jgi:predicted PurR-regulated permease PerM
MARPTEPWSAERLRFTAVSGGLVVAALVLTTAARNLFVAAHRPLGWGLASAGVAVLLEPLVRRLSRWMKRGLAILLVMLEQALPVAAAQLEQDETVGGLARDFRLRDRVEMFVGDLGDRLSRRSALEGAATSVPVYFVNAVLVVFFLVWGPRFRAGFLRQLSDDDQRKRYDGIITVAARQSGRYLLAMAAQAFGAAVLTGIALWALDVPTPAALATLVGLASFVPYVGVLFGCVPALLLSGGLRPGVVTGMLAAFFIVVQVGTGLVQHRIHRWTLRVGPAATVIAAVLGSGVYGLGGAVYGALLAMFGLAVLEAAGDGGERRSVARPG